MGNPGAFFQEGLAVALAAAPLATIARFTRSSMIEVLQSDYVRVARAKGLGERAIVLRQEQFGYASNRVWRAVKKEVLRQLAADIVSNDHYLWAADRRNHVGLALDLNFNFKPRENWEIRVGPNFTRSYEAAQYVATVADARAALSTVDAAARRARAVGRGEEGSLAIGMVGSSVLITFILFVLTVGLGVVVLGETLRPRQWAAIGVATLAVLVLVVSGRCSVVTREVAWSRRRRWARTGCGRSPKGARRGQRSSRCTRPKRPSAVVSPMSPRQRSPGR